MADVGIGRIQSGHVRAQSFGDGPVAREDRLRHLFVLRLHGGRQACDARAQRVAFGAQLGLIGLIGSSAPWARAAKLAGRHASRADRIKRARARGSRDMARHRRDRGLYDIRYHAAAPTGSLRHEHRVDDVDHAVGLVDIIGADIGDAALSSFSMMLCLPFIITHSLPPLAVVSSAAPPAFLICAARASKSNLPGTT